MRPVRPKTPKRTIPKVRASAKDPIIVYCRIRPLDNELDLVCLRAKDERTVVLFNPDVAPQVKAIKEVHYTFAQAFSPETSQKQLFDQVAYPLVQDLLQGSNGLLFTYGITSSGKTYTMTGSAQDGGLLPRSLDVIFNSLKDFQSPKYVFKPDNFNEFDIQSKSEALRDQQKEFGSVSKTPKPKRRDNYGEWTNRLIDTSVVEDVNSDMSYSVFVSYVEIYNNYIYDLLEDSTIDLKRKNFNSKMMREDAKHNMYVFGAVETEVKSAEEALELFNRGQQKRKVSNTALNTESSRSHSVFTIRVVQAPLDLQGAEVLQDKNQIVISQLSLVDLAGSERTLRTKNTGKNLREAGNINTSLMALRTCIEALRESQTQATSKMIPYRDSKLTHLFKTFFEGEGKIRMIVCVNPRADNYEETTHVMRFAEMTQDVMISRPTPVTTPSVLGLRSGRGNVYREAIRKAKEQGVPVEEMLAPVVYSLGPEFPQLIVNLSDDESIYVNLIDFLNSRIVRRRTYEQDLQRRQEDFRNCLIAVDKENVQLKQEKTILQMDLVAREQQVRNLERKFSSSDEMIETLRKQLHDSQHEATELRHKLDHKERKINEQGKEIDHIKMKMNNKLALEKDRYRRIMERRLAAKQAELARKMCLTQEKFRQLREIMNDWDDWDNFPMDDDIPVVESTSPSEVSAPTSGGRKSRRRSADDPPVIEPKISKTRSQMELGSRSSRNNAPTSSINDFDSLFAKENKPPSSSQRSAAIANLRHRRSCSEEKWIEHKPVGNLELNTVLQPKMKRKKSVSKLKVKDVTSSDVSKYVLQHQEQDSQGELETQLFKGDVIPSAGGGAQIVFNDVEKLKQMSPPAVYNLRKRSGESLPLREIEDRCSISVGCHGLPSKLLKKN